MDIAKEAAETKRLMEAWKALYEDGGSDVDLRDAAREIFKRIDNVIKQVRGNSIVMDLMNRARKEFERSVEQVCANRHAPELQKYLAKHRKTHL